MKTFNVYSQATYHSTLRDLVGGLVVRTNGTAGQALANLNHDNGFETLNLRVHLQTLEQR